MDKSIEQLKQELQNVEQNVSMLPPMWDCTPVQERVLKQLENRWDYLLKTIDQTRAKAQYEKILEEKLAKKREMLAAPMTNAFDAAGL